MLTFLAFQNLYVRFRHFRSQELVVRCGTPARQFSHTGSCVEISSVHSHANVTLSTNPRMTYWQPRMVALNVSNNRDTSNKQNRQSLHFVVRSGLAGGIAGCVVSPTRFTLQREIPTGTLIHIRQRLWLHHLIEWKYFFRHPIQIFKNTQACTQLVFLANYTDRWICLR